MYPKSLIQSTDYATLANDNVDPILLSVTVPDGSSGAVTSLATLLITGSPIIFSITNSITNEEWSCQSLQYVCPNGRSIGVTVRQTAVNTVSIRAVPDGAINGGTVTFTARVRSFVPPVP